jgi:hypothetical protein
MSRMIRQNKNNKNTQDSHTDNTLVCMFENEDTVSPLVEKHLKDDSLDLSHWRAICMNTALSEDFREKFYKNVKDNKNLKQTLANNIKVNPDFFTKHIEDFNDVEIWNVFLRNKNLPESFFDTHYDRIRSFNNSELLKLLIKHPNITKNLIYKHIELGMLYMEK